MSRIRGREQIEANHSIPRSPLSRESLLKKARNYKMARSAHAYVRGSTVKFYEWLDSMSRSALPEGPTAWICGDCHVGNLGPVSDSEGHVEIQIRDFDQTVIGNPAHDLIRLGLSLSMAARSSDLPGVTTARMMERLVHGYRQAFDVRRIARTPDRPDAVYKALREAQRRSWRHLSKERVSGETVSIPLGPRFWPLVKAERQAIAALFESDASQELARRMHHRSTDDAVRFVDASYWMKGCSSLGRLRFAVLLDVGGKAALRRDLCLIDIKEAVAAAAPRSDNARMPRDNADRVVEGARHMSPHLGDRMVASRLLGRSVFMRELLPQDLKLEIDRITPDEAIKAAHYLARVVGRAHARQLDGDQRRQWHQELSRNRSKTLDAPSWLWNSVVELVGTHERAYLDHCRRYALESGGIRAARSSRARPEGAARQAST